MEAVKNINSVGNLVWVAFDMFRDYYISDKDGSVYVSEPTGFNPKSCDGIPSTAHLIINSTP